MIRNIILLVIIYCSFCATTVLSNNSDTLLSKKDLSDVKDTTFECHVTTSSRKIFKDVSLFGLKDSSVYVLSDEHSKKISINEIRTIKFKARGFWTGALIGYGIGFLTGALLGSQSLGFSNEIKVGPAFAAGFFIGIPFGLIGGGIGALLAKDQFYDLSALDYETKRNKISELMIEYSAK